MPHEAKGEPRQAKSQDSSVEMLVPEDAKNLPVFITGTKEKV